METTIYTIDGKDFELRHYGVKGMKWGVRRYQNKDGSLTAKGRNRYGLDESGNLVKKSAGTRAFEALARSGYANQKKQQALYDTYGTEYNKRSADQWKREADANSESARRSFEVDKRIARDKKSFKADVKDFKKNGFGVDYEIDQIGQFKVTEYYNSRQEKLGKDYAERVLAQARKDNARVTLGTTAAVLGASVVAGILAEMG